MVKLKKSISAAKKAAKRNAQQKTVTNNPFEVHVNKQKYEILGRKMKHDRGLPGVSRSKAMKKRQKTLLTEYKQKNKANIFVDKRFGENDAEMTLEDKLMQRFTIEKQHHHAKAGIYNLEEEELTHLGHSLGDVGKFDDVRLSDEEDQEDEKDVQDAHFGGFLMKATKQESDRENEEGKHRSRKEIMEEVVAKSKLKKHERQMAKAESSNLTETLDQDWKEIRSMLSFRDPHHKTEVKADDYDIAVKELAFELKGKATNKLKTDEQIAKEEQERLSRLEAERIRRMRGLPPEDSKPKHTSADDLGDSFSIQTDDRISVSYWDGKINLPEGEETLEYEWLGKKAGKSDGSDDGDKDGDGEEIADESGEDEDDDDDISGEDDAGSDLDSDPESADEDEQVEISNAKKHKKDLMSSVKKSSSVAAKKELPFTFNAPKNYSEFTSMISKWKRDDVLTIIERIKACNHPKILPENKIKMEIFFSILLEFMKDLLTECPPDIKTVNKLTRHLFDIAQHSPVNTSRVVQGFLRKAQSQFTEQLDCTGGKGKFPGLDTLMMLPLITVLFPTSDFKHSVCTPAMVYIAELLAQSRVRCITDVLKGLFLCSTVLEFIGVSKRLVPEAINFLCGTFYLASDKTSETSHLLMPFKAKSKWSDLLKIQTDENATVIKEAKVSIIEALSDGDLSNTQTRVSVLHLALRITSELCELYKDLPAFKETFSPVLCHLHRIPIKTYPAFVKELHSSLVARIEALSGQVRSHLALQTRKPQPIKTFEPKFDEHYDIKSKKNKGSKKANEDQKLKYKFKREFKGAIREVRKDSQFLARQKHQEQMDRDAERMRKVKQIEHMLSNQQAETNEMNRKKRKHRA
ncbi:nucleolar protein 14 [Nematostella vectensis]|uniref:nucleolar protein 14 n=1 Tax=Nematostella vectensis TaxID=45351 RepID=UPI0020777EF1|nr:nucleolar protein 14 [Nematostella vectensis]